MELREPQQKALLKLHWLYTAVPSFQCKPGCTDCCGPHLQAEIEWVNISRWLKARGRQELIGSHIDCQYIENNQCSIYEVRPMQCRLFGAVKGMLCPHGCKPTRLLSELKARNLLTEVIYLLPPSSHGTGA